MTAFVYVDNSHIRGGGEHIQAGRAGGAPDGTAPWTYDLGRLFDLLDSPGIPIGRSVLFGPKPPADDLVWERFGDEDFQVVTLTHGGAGKNAQQTEITLMINFLEGSFLFAKPAVGDTIVLAAGDEGFLPVVASLRARGLRVKVVSWSHEVGAGLRDAADEFLDLDAHFDRLTRSASTA